ncbi:SIS domain-containing protein [bacterium]|nr:SIS domain-containing protein [bacterium]
MEDIRERILLSIQDSKKAIASLESQIDSLFNAVGVIVSAIESGNKIMFVGNGGSAADAQHASAEFVGQLGLGVNRRPIPAIALTTDTSAITALANDFGWEEVFSRQVEALAVSGDILVCISTSGNSSNIVRAAQSAKALGCQIIGLTGPFESKLSRLADFCLLIDGPNTPRIQEGHELALHLICEFSEIYLSKT